MTGGVAYVCDRRRTLVARTNPQHLAVEPLSAPDQKIVRHLLETHERLTGSRLARAILRHDRGLTTFRRVASVSIPGAAAQATEANLVEEIDETSRSEKAAAS
jgi:glutamate synthase domain-containing protein 3